MLPFRYSPALRASIGEYACYHGVAKATRRFSRQLGWQVSESTVRSIKNDYVQEVRSKRKAQDEGDITVLPYKKRGRPVLLGEALDCRVQAYLKKTRQVGGAISSRTVIAAARGIIMVYDKTILEEFGGHVRLTRSWAHALLKRMNFVKRAATTSGKKYTADDFARVKKDFLDDVVSTVSMEEIPPSLILNWDQTGIKLVPSSSWTMDQRGTKHVELAGVNDKRQITAVFCGTIVGDFFLPIQLIYQGKTSRCHPNFQFPSSWDITHSPRHWSTEETMLQYIDYIIIPYVDGVRDLIGDHTKPAVVIMDNFKGQTTESVKNLLEDHNIHTCYLPPNTTDLLQPMDISVNKPAKDYVKRQFQEWYSRKVMEQLEGVELGNIEEIDIEPIDLSLAMLRGWS